MVDWNEVASILDRIAGTSDDTLLDHGQKASVTELACRIRAGQRSALLADEVGMGKTRIAAALIAAASAIIVSSIARRPAVSTITTS